MKFVVVIQRVRGGNVSSPSRLKLSRQVGSEPACVPVRGGMEPGAASMQAVLLSPEICMVADIRITSGTLEGKPTAWNGWKATILNALWQAGRIPPGSEIRACIQRDSSGTRESLLSPCTTAGRTPGEQSPRRRQCAFPCRRAKPESRHGIGERATKRRASRWASGSLSRSYYR